jgi:electron transport complex protein RnfE
MSFLKQIKNGIIAENPTFRLVIGMCPTLAVTTSAVNGLGMGLSTAIVLIGSNVVISAMRKVVPNKIRIPIFIVVIASFVTIVSMLLQAYVPSLYKSLGIFIPLIVVNCIILQRAEAFANQNTVMQSMADGIGMGLGFTLALTILGLVREFIGAGSIFGISILGSSFEPALIFIQPPGAFLTLGLLMALVNVIAYNKKQKKAKAGSQI